MKRRRIPIEIHQHADHNHGANKHRDGTKYPEQQIRGKIERSKASEPEITPSDHLLDHTLHRDIVIRHADQEVSMNKVPSRLNKTGEGRQKTRKQRYVLYVNHRRASAAIDISPGEEIS